MRGADWFAQRIPPPDALARLGDDIDALVDVAIDRAVVDGSLEAVAKRDVLAATLARAVELAALISANPDLELSVDDRAVLDLFVLVVARPALFVREHKPVGAPPENWPELRRDRDAIPDVVAAVGRLQTAGGVKLGTGFIAGTRRVLTNNHVVCMLLGYGESFWRTRPEVFAAACAKPTELWAGGSPVFELLGEAGREASSTARVAAVAGHHASLDLAVLELAAMPDGAQRIALSAAAPDPIVRRRIFAVGYPVQDNLVAPTPDLVFARIFGRDAGTLGAKRLSPGTFIAGGEALEVWHDASTLPGSSGSCIVDFDTRRALAIHLGGSYGERNRAVPLWKLVDDPLLSNLAFR